MKKFDWQAPMKIDLLVLKLFGIWPPGESYGYNWYTLYAIMCINLFSIAHNLCQTINIFFVITDLKALTSIIFVTLTAVLGSVKTFYFTHRVRLLKKLMVKLSSKIFQPRSDEQRALVEPSLRFWKMTYKAFWVPVCGTLLLWACFPILDGSIKNRRLPFEAWYPFNAKESPFYEIAYVHQVISVSIIAISTLNMDMLIAALMVFIGAQCEILYDDLRSFKTEIGLVHCIGHHKIIVEFAENCNRFFNMIILGQFFVSAVSIAVALFQLTLVEPFSSECYSLLFYVSSITMEIFLYCWFGNEVQAKISTTYRMLLKQLQKI